MPETHRESVPRVDTGELDTGPARQVEPGWTVWRQDDNGNRYEVSRHRDRAEAEAVAARMESRGHKQIYWVAPTD